MTKMGMRLAAVLPALFSLILLTVSSPLHTSFSSVELQERKLTENGIMQSIKEGHAGSVGGGGGGSGHGGSGGEGEGSSDPSSGGPPGRPLNGAGTANTRNNRPHHGAGIRCSSYNLSMLTVFITLSLGFFL